MLWTMVRQLHKLLLRTQMPTLPRSPQSRRRLFPLRPMMYQ